MRVLIPSPLRSYTNQARSVTANGDTLEAVLNDLDAQYPGIRFRMVDEQDDIRRHIVIFVDGERTRALDTPTASVEEIVIQQALSGG